MDALDFLPLFSETMARIRARMDADANAGVDPNSSAYIDTREGGFYWDTTQVSGLEIARLWDALGSETVAAAFPALAWGAYLDYHGSTFNLARNAAISATGVALFTGDSGAFISTGTQIQSNPADPSKDAIVFQTTASGSTGTQILAPTVSVAASGTGGTLQAATYIYHVTSYNAYGESIGCADRSAVISTTTGRVLLSWSEVTGATGYRIYRTLVPGGSGGRIGDTGSKSFVDYGTVDPTVTEPGVNTTAGVRLPISAMTPGRDGNLASNAITTMGTVVTGIDAVTNEDATVGGFDVEDDEYFRNRILGQYQGQGSGNVNDYVKWAIAYPGCERAACIPIWLGAGTVLVIPMLADGSAVSSNVVSGIQAMLDPEAGLGRGQAPIGANVTVATTTPLNVTIVATVVHANGFSLDGTNGTFATRVAIVDAITKYVNRLDPGDTIGYQNLLSCFFQVIGVQSVSGLTLNGSNVDVQLDVAPPKSASLSTPTLTDG